MIIETDSLTRTFVRRGKGLRRTTMTAVDNLTVSVAAGEAVGYIGANGAGKSTTIKMLVGILVPTSGSVRTCGLDPVRRRRELARHVGVVFGQRSQLWWDLPTRDSFKILAAIHQVDGTHRLDVRIPAPAGPPMRVRHRLAEARGLSADIAHGSHINNSSKSVLGGSGPARRKTAGLNPTT